MSRSIGRKLLVGSGSQYRRTYSTGVVRRPAAGKSDRLLVATFMIDHFDLFGLRQAWLHSPGRPYTPPPFMIRGAYRYVRHPIMVGVLVGFWATPTMTVGHLLFAAGFTVYIWIGTRFEERDVVRHLGDAYRRYQETVPKLMPRLTRASAQ